MFFPKGDDRAGAYPKLVGAFTRKVYEFLKTCTTSAGTLSATISTGQAAFPVVQKVLDSRQEEAKKSGKGGKGLLNKIFFFSSFLCINFYY